MKAVNLMKNKKLFKIMTFEESRKVGVGMWVFIFCNIYLPLKLITSTDWITGVIVSATLIGGGTIADKYFDRKG